MSEHTKEPWAVYDGDEIHGVLDSDGKHLAEMWHRKQYNSLANATRIVACVNACAGMADPTAELAALRERVRELATHTSNLLALLAMFEETWDEDSASASYFKARMDSDTFHIFVDQASAALRKDGDK